MTNIVISSDNFRTVTPDEVRFGEGDSVVISAAEDAPSILVFSPAAQAILEPDPGPQLAVNSGQAHTFTFKSAEPGIYTIAVADAEFGGLNETTDEDSRAQELGSSAANLEFEVISMKPSPLPPPPPKPESGPAFHPNSGG